MKALKLSSFILTASLLATGFNMPEAKAQLPSPDLAAFCIQEHGGGTTLVNILPGNNPKGLRCKTSGGRNRPISVRKACQRQFGNRYIAQIRNNGWRCNSVLDRRS